MYLHYRPKKGGKGGNISSIPTVRFLMLAVCENKNRELEGKVEGRKGRQGEGGGAGREA